jgi:alpha-L-rhamnosidase
MKKWMSKWVDTLAATSYVFEGRTWGDHEPAFGSGMSNDLVGTAYVYRSAQALAEIAEALGKDADAQSYRTFATRVREAVNATYYDADAGHYDFPYEPPSFGPPPGMDLPEDAGPPPGMPAWMTMPAEEVNARQFQTDNVLPLALGLVPPPDYSGLCEQLVQDVETTHDTHITTGATVLKDVMPVLTECGAAELAFRAATNPTFPGWGYWFEGLNGTEGPGGEEIIVDTYWEAWGEGARSHNHAFRGTIDDWLYQYLAGIRVAAPGYRRILVKPYPVGDVTHARASILTPLGEVVSSWRRDGDTFELEVRIPVGATAEVHVPMKEGDDVSADSDAQLLVYQAGYAVYEVRSGAYAFRGTSL